MLCCAVLYCHDHATLSILLQVAVKVLDNGMRPGIPQWCPHELKSLIEVHERGSSMTSTSLGGEAWCAGEILCLALRAYVLSWRRTSKGLVVRSMAQLRSAICVMVDWPLTPQYKQPIAKNV